MNNIKKELGQFMSKNNQLIQRFVEKIQPESVLIDPFAGELDLVKDFPNARILYDLDPKHEEVIQRDSLLNPPEFKDFFVITNPPYLNINKTSNKTVFNQYKTDDLYKASLKMLISQNVKEGIVIIPSSFWLNINSKEIRTHFLSNYIVEVAQIFNHRTFSDTSYGVSSFYFRKEKNNKQNILLEYPDSSGTVTKSNEIIVGDFNEYTVSNDIEKELLKFPIKLKIGRYTNKNQNPTNIFLHTIDTAQPIRAEVAEPFLGKNTDRSFLTFVVEGLTIKESEEQEIVNLFNRKLNLLRETYSDMFLSNYRENGRKRMTFTFAYKLLEDVLTDYFKGDNNEKRYKN